MNSKNRAAGSNVCSKYGSSQIHFQKQTNEMKKKIISNEKQNVVTLQDFERVIPSERL